MAIKITTRNELGDVRHNIKTCINRQHVQGGDKLICYTILGGRRRSLDPPRIRHPPHRMADCGGWRALDTEMCDQIEDLEKSRKGRGGLWKAQRGNRCITCASEQLRPCRAHELVLISHAFRVFCLSRSKTERRYHLGRFLSTSQSCSSSAQ